VADLGRKEDTWDHESWAPDPGGHGITDYYSRNGRLYVRFGNATIERVVVETPKVEAPTKRPAPPPRRPDPALSRIADLAKAALYSGETLDPAAVLSIVGATSS